MSCSFICPSQTNWGGKNMVDISKTLMHFFEWKPFYLNAKSTKCVIQSPIHNISLVIEKLVRIMISSNGNIVRVTGPLCGKFTGHRGNHRSPIKSPDKGQWRGTLMFCLICARTNGLVNNRDAIDLRCHYAHYDVIVKGWYSTCVQAIT